MPPSLEDDLKLLTKLLQLVRKHWKGFCLAVDIFHPSRYFKVSCVRLNVVTRSISYSIKVSDYGYTKE